MEINKVGPEEYDNIVEMFKANPKYSDIVMPSVRNIIGCAVAKDGEVVAYGFVALFPELFIVVNPKKSKFSICKAIVSLFKLAKKFSFDAGFETVYCQTTDPTFAGFLTRRLKFFPLDSDLLINETK